MTNTAAPAPGDPNIASAGFFAREAKRVANQIADPQHRLTASADDREIAAAEATALALTSLALTSLNPPARRRPFHPQGLETRGGKR